MGIVLAAADAVLLGVGRRFDVLASQLDDGLYECEVLEEFSRILAKIGSTPATTMEGLCVKARAACWTLLGDLDASERCSTAERVGLSIMRDLIRLYRPSLEQPGALTKLVKEIEDNAAASSTRENGQEG
jgi:hypothetical protein